MVGDCLCVFAAVPGACPALIDSPLGMHIRKSIFSRVCSEKRSGKKATER